MKIPALDGEGGHLDRLSKDGPNATVTVREADLAELERRYHSQRETIRGYQQFATRVQKEIDQGIGSLASLRDAAYEVGR